MLKMLVSYLPDWKVFVQTFIVFFVPYVTSRVFSWIRTLEKE
ncbi:hypothetical protein COL53_04945 [Bacillus pseudomycoides]|nr:hypothetical protein CON58_12880 [Bacillus pseudomycoides]PFY93654.1 hypothetical protein COL53_04945 [Bacillus pseudomycoides]